MIAPAPTCAPGQRVRIRIVARYSYREFAQYGGEVAYPGANFDVPANAIVEIIDRTERLALLELDATIVHPNGRAAFLVEHRGHWLSIHAQQIHPARPEEIEA